MSDLIDRQAILKHIEKIRQDALKMDDLREKSIIMTGMHLCEDAVRIQPSAQRTGRWIKNEGRHGWHCSECMETNYYAYSWNSETGREEFQDHYCPNCGARMKGGDDGGET